MTKTFDSSYVGGTPHKPVDWALVEKRMDQGWLFKDMVKEQDVSCYECFSKQFRRHYGEYPSVYKARKEGRLHDVYIK